MNITFLIGNGFDLNLGMKTRYTDMYDSYINSESSNEVIAKFKEDLKKDEHKHYENWSDFEMGMANYASNFVFEDDFIACIRDFKAHMVKHLKLEEQNYAFNTSKLIDELWDSITSFYTGCTPNVTHSIEDIIFKSNSCVCSFVTFNYTHILDAIIELTTKNRTIRGVNYRLKSTLHIHGDLNNDVVLGVDNASQIRSLFLKTRKTDLAFIKPKFNNAYDNRRVNQTLDSINNSSVICAFGLSLGESDKTWTIALKEWLLADEENHLVFYVYNEEEIPAYNYDLKIEKEYELKNIIFKKMGLTQEQMEIVENKVHVPINHKIFNFIEKTSTDELVAV